jgi:hypothetical protein
MNFLLCHPFLVRIGGFHGMFTKKQDCCPGNSPVMYVVIIYPYRTQQRHCPPVYTEGAA